MKKLLMIAAVFLLAITAACSQDSEGTEDKKSEETNTEETGTENETSEEELKVALLNFQSEVVDVLQAHQGPFNEFQASKETYLDEEAEEKPTTEELEALKKAAEEEGPKAAEAIRSISIPSELSKYEEEMKTALEDAAASYEKRAESLTIEASEDAQAEADELFASFEEKMGKAFEDLGLTAPSFSAELS
ncbi:hypothetical protein [Pseudalkalibacillus berkeleyi]|uniref:Lipoprotein n=1 Tax=Pseudalkalibacillus berkeleyi TaxID=1069813 RepID=A0ABS9H6X5_9BACL|nr:hypothetical protein [Pseudalkalibacillus berkeleyi]MCF6139627.1 hypothetical protein [Pseudalkalibacillus berkeleyi]